MASPQWPCFQQPTLRALGACWHVNAGRELLDRFLFPVLCLVAQLCPTLCYPMVYSPPGAWSKWFFFSSSSGVSQFLWINLWNRGCREHAGCAPFVLPWRETQPKVPESRLSLAQVGSLRCPVPRAGPQVIWVRNMATSWLSKAPPWCPQPSTSCCPTRPSSVRCLLRGTFFSSGAGVQVCSLQGAWHWAWHRTGTQRLFSEQMNWLRWRWMNWSSPVSQMSIFNSKLTEDWYIELIILISNRDMSVSINRNPLIGQIPSPSFRIRVGHFLTLNYIFKPRDSWPTPRPR